MNANKISILFLLSKAKKNVKGQCPIKCRITFRRERKEFSTGYFIEEENWNNIKQKAVGKNADNIHSNLGLIKQKLEQIYHYRQITGKRLLLYIFSKSTKLLILSKKYYL